MNKQNKTNKMDQNLVMQELKGNPYSKLNMAFSLMVIVPFLVFFYLLTSKLFTLNILIGNTGFVLGTSLFISLCGFYLVYSIVRNVFNKILAYAEQAKHSDKLKSTFVATVSHELKNPLASIKVNIYNVFSGFIGQVNEEQKNVLENCQSTIERMVRLVNGLLDLHKIEAGVVDSKRSNFNLVKILEKQVKDLQIIADKKNINIVKEFLNENLSIWGDEDKLSQAVINLLDNGIKFTPENGTVTLKTYPDDKFIRIECIDVGLGISDDKIGLLFNKFERLNSTEEGTGLGLAITKDIVEMHGGKVLVESQVGKGSKFTIILPHDLRLTKR